MKIQFVKRDESADWDPAILAACGGKIETVYLFNPNERTFCCEMTPSHYLVPVAYVPAETPDDEEDRNALDEVLAYARPIYVHCSQVRRVPKHTWTGMESLEHAIESYNANPIF